ncbi:MAG TPA: xanthine dehydrogenase accessory protein XdhC [Xanthobacteraceae bacterium]|nr:xanthine dehydrogenase accessory protein XdhC [Xanthobacteraceae bacterium]
MEPWRTIHEWIERDGSAALVTVARAEGSTPREAGARMAVARDGTISGSIGGGPLEWAAIDLARALIDRGRGAEWRTISLGPALDQCCGGRAEILHESFSREDLEWIAPLAAAEEAEQVLHGERRGKGPYRRRRTTGGAPNEAVAAKGTDVLVERIGETNTPLLLFGGGHVGRALVTALQPLPFAIRWIDDRAEAFDGAKDFSAHCVVSALPESELSDARAGSFVLVMTHSHALDLALVTAALPDARFPYVGLIGSGTKRALFERRLAEFGVSPDAIARLVCPIGVPGIAGKSPAVIAAAVAAELLIERERAKSAGTIKTEFALG